MTVERLIVEVQSTIDFSIRALKYCYEIKSFHFMYKYGN